MFMDNIEIHCTLFYRTFIYTIIFQKLKYTQLREAARCITYVTLQLTAMICVVYSVVEQTQDLSGCTP
jgi:hypothetical protein